MKGGLIRKVMLSVGMALSLVGGLLVIFGVSLRWGFRVGILAAPDITGLDMITTTIAGNLNVFLVLIGGAIAFLSSLASALFRNRAFGQKIALYLVGLGMVFASAGCIWSIQKYGSVPPGLFTSMLGTSLLAIGAILLIFVNLYQASR